MYTNNKIAKAVRLAIAFGAASTLTMHSVAVNAQEEAAAEQQVEKIQITGSRIRSANAVSTSPIATVGELEIEQQQQPEIERIFRNMPASLPGDNSNVNNGTGGAATVNLRGLGSNRNLVLMNGKRMVPYNTAGSVDTSTIPTAIIDRIDIVTGGASAVYGSDAISGAINVILKKNFEGVELDMSHSRTADADAQTKNIARKICEKCLQVVREQVACRCLSPRFGAANYSFLRKARALPGFFMSASLTSLSYAPVGAAIPGSVRARFIARRSACLPFGLLLESEVNMALWQQGALKGVPLARGPLSISEHHRLSF